MTVYNIYITVYQFLCSLLTFQFEYSFQQILEAILEKYISILITF